jgi:hypothetical protein
MVPDGDLQGSWLRAFEAEIEAAFRKFFPG